MRLGALIHLLLLITGNQTPPADAPAFYSVGYDDCVAVEEQHQVHVGSPRVVLAAAQKPLRVSIDAMIPWRAPSFERRPQGDCTDAFRKDLEDSEGARAKVTQFAHVSPLPQDQYGLFFVVPPSSAIILGGAPAALGARESRRLVDGIRASLPRNWRVDRTLVRAYRYGPAGGHTIDELYVGLPRLNPAGSDPPIKRISIRRFFLVDGTLAASEKFDRESGVEERAETTAADLTYANWSRSETEHTVAFISRDQGHSWERLSTNGGFEGIHWIVQSLRAGLPEVFHRWLYTPH
jgi:hypothetical protein